MSQTIAQNRPNEGSGAVTSHEETLPAAKGLSMETPAAARMNYLIIIPAFNEEGSIRGVIDDVRLHVPFADVLVVNDGSTDRTSSVAEEQGVPCVSHPFNLGYGAALQTGFRFATARDYDCVITMDADGQHVPLSVSNLVTAMQHHGADVVIGSRFLEGNYEVDLPRRIGIGLFSFIARLFTGITITDPTSGFQLLRRSVFSHLAKADNYPLDYPDVNIIMALHKRRFKIVETPVGMIEKRNGKSMHSGLKPFLYVMRMCLAIVMVIFRGRVKKR
jgi:hypothetical protein